jgi:PPOX class probable FMN-dependent enzyme
MAVFEHALSSEAELRELYRQPSKLVQSKKVPRLDEVTRAFIAASPFCLVATADADGRCDVSPKGGPPGFVKVLDDTRVALPDLNGNNLLDSLQNVVGNGYAGLLILLPGKDETLRIDGSAHITTDPAVLALWDDELRRPKVALGIKVESAFIHCAKAFRRGRVWDPSTWSEYEGAPDGCDLIVSHLDMTKTAAELRPSFEEGYASDLANDRPQ